MASVPSSLLSALAASRDAVIEYQTRLTALPALDPENGGEGELNRALYLESVLRQIGVKNCSRIDAQDSRVPSGIRPNVIAKIPGRSPHTLWVLGHMDVVPTGDLALWKTDPWKIKVDGDKIIGRGVQDNQHAIVAMLLLAQALTAQKITPDLSLGLLFVADEECGSHFGAEYLLKARPDLFDPADLILTPDIGMPDGSGIEIAEKGQFWLRVTVTGRQCHASHPDEGKNSLTAAADMIVHIADVADRFSAQNSLFDPPKSTITPTRHDQNVPNINTVAGQDVFYIDCRLLPDVNPEDVFAGLRKVFGKIADQRGVKFTLEVVHASPVAPITPKDNEAVRRLCTGIRSVYHIAPYCYGAGGGTVAACFRRKNLPAVAWASIPPTAHIANEYTLISKIIGDAQVMATMLFDAA